MKKLKACIAALAMLGSLLVGYAATSTPVGATTSIDKWSDGAYWSMHWHLDTFDDGSQHLNVDCFQGATTTLSCLEIWSTMSLGPIKVYPGTPRVTSFEVKVDTPSLNVESVYKNYVNYRDPNNGPTIYGPINPPGVYNAFFHVGVGMPTVDFGVVRNLHLPFFWLNSGAVHQLFTES